jgi:hypothetical protein
VADVSVNPAELSAGVGKVAALFGDCETATVGVEEVLMGMTSSAGHPGLVSALTAFGESSTKALANTGQVLTYIAQGLKQNASEYSKTEAANAHNITSAGSGKAK